MLPVVRLHAWGTLEGVYLIVTEVTTDKLKLDETYLVEQVVIVVVVLMEHKFEELASYTKMDCLELTRLESRLLIAIK